MINMYNAGWMDRLRFTSGSGRKLGGHALAHAVCILAPGVVSVQHTVRSVSEPAVQFDRDEVPCAHLESARRDASFAAHRLCGLHHESRNATAASLRVHPDGKDSARVL